MKTEVTLETKEPDTVRRILQPSLSSDEKVSYKFETGNQELVISVETDGLGPLRGCTDTVFRLTTLANRIYFN